MAEVFGCRRVKPRHPFLSLSIAILCLGGFFLPQVTEAQTQDTTVFRIRGLDIRVPRPATTTGGTSAVEVSMDSLGVVAAPTVEDLLRVLPLIQVRANSRGEAQPSLRGAEDRQIAVLVDGIPLTLGWDHRTDLSILPLTAVRNVTLLRGLSSVLHGPNVLGGAVEFDVARGSGNQGAPPTLQSSLSLDHEGGISGSVAAGTLLERDFSSWVLRTGAGFRDRPGITVPSSVTDHSDLRSDLLFDEDDLRLNSDRRQIDGFASARYQGIGGSWASGLVSAFSAERGVAPEAHVDDPRLWRYPDQDRALIAISGGTGQRSTGAGHGDLEFSLGIDRSSAHIEQFETAAYQNVIDGETSEGQTLTARLLGDHSLGSRGELRSAFTFANVTHDEAFNDGSAFEYQQRLWSAGFEAEVVSDGIFGVGTSGQTRWTAGFALDGASTPKSGDKPKLESLSDWGVRFGSTTTPGDGNVVYHWGLSRRTRFPSLRELYSGALGRFLPNPTLRPEKLTAGEVGATLDRGWGQLQIVGFHHRLSDGIVRTRVTTDEVSQFRRENRNEVRSTGMEFLLSGGFHRFTYGADLTLQQVTVRDALVPANEDKAEYQPAVSGKLNVATAVGRGWVLGALLQHRGRQYCQNPQADRMDSLDPSTRVDLEIRRTFDSPSGFFPRANSVETTLALANAFDGTVLDQCGLPQAGRTLRFQVNLR